MRLFNLLFTGLEVVDAFLYGKAFDWPNLLREFLVNFLKRPEVLAQLKVSFLNSWKPRGKLLEMCNNFIYK
jgi:hypothetical protein